MPRIEPVSPPYPPDVEAQLTRMMPPGVSPLLLFRTFARNLPLAEAMGSWGAYELSKRLSLTMRDREIVIIRTCARCRCEYEWGVHVAFFADRVSLHPDQIASLTHGHSTDPVWDDPRDRALIDAVDALHEHADIDDDLWPTLAATFTDAEALDVMFLCGWYHAISFAANAARVGLETGAPTFDGIEGGAAPASVGPG